MLCPDCSKHMRLKQKSQRIDYEAEMLKRSEYFYCTHCQLLLYIRRQQPLLEAVEGGKR